ncbi:MAG: ABC transporter ATP-binding protein [Chloroflexota bacterium]|nr:ABC transporter ATP-binding protein [Chloroflexota bacterium]MDH5244330.1 ABC transporter ATP-binding protein [Chloroflexota bacterium]
MRDGPAIQLDALTRSFGATRAVDGLSVDVPRGMIFGFLGPNGAGKTTTIHLLLGLLEPTSGQAEVLGFDPWRQGDEVRSRTGAVLEDTGIYEALTAEANLEFFARAWRMPSDQRRDRIRELLSGMGLWDRRREKAGTWSRGMQQRLALARALLHRPALLFLDEPTAGLDVMAATAVRDDLATLAGRDGATIFLTTHNMAEAERLCSVVAVIRAGRLVALGSPSELRARTGPPRLEIFGSGFDEQTIAVLRARPEVAGVQRVDGHLTLQLGDHAESGPLVSLLVRGGAQIDEVRRGQANLEEVFVTLMEEEA